MDTFTLMQGFGVLGFIGYLAGFAGLQAGLIDGNGRAYCLINVASASLVLISLAEAFNLASALIQVSWIAIGLGGLAFKICRKTNKTEGQPVRQQAQRTVVAE